MLVATKDRFDLENDLNHLYNIVDDLDLLLEAVCDNPHFEMPADVCDRVANYIIGVKEVYKLRHERVEDTFKQCFKLDDYRELKLEEPHPYQYTFNVGDQDIEVKGDVQLDEFDGPMHFGPSSD